MEPYSNEAIDEHHRFDEEESNPDEGKVQCMGCCKLTDEPYKCAFCSRDFCVRSKCIDLNYKDTGLDLCLNCQEEKGTIIHRLVQEVEKMQAELKYERKNK